MNAVAQMMELFAEEPSLFPDPCPQLLAAGALTPLNKLCRAERRMMEYRGAPPRVRPINAGTLFAKSVLATMLSTPEAQCAAQKVKPFQLSLGTKRGTERMVHSSRAAYLGGWIVGKNDIANGFNTLARQSLLDAHSLFFPQSTKIFNAIYGVDAPVFLTSKDQGVSTLWSQQGSRQGCALGTESFCFAMDGPVRKMHRKYPEFIFKVLTDDIVVLCPPPDTSKHGPP